MTKKYIRNTHINKAYREDMEDIWNKIPNGIRGLVHLLHPVKPMSTHDIMVELYCYASEYPSENDAQLFGSVDIMELMLELLVNFDMVKVVDTDRVV